MTSTSSWMYTLALATCGTVPVAPALLPGETGMCSNFAVAQRTPLPAPEVEGALTRSQQARRRRGVAAAVGPVAAAVEGTVDRAIGDDPVDDREGIIGVLGYVWQGALVVWLNGRGSLAQVGNELERAARLLLRPLP